MNIQVLVPDWLFQIIRNKSYENLSLWGGESDSPLVLELKRPEMAAGFLGGKVNDLGWRSPSERFSHMDGETPMYRLSIYLPVFVSWVLYLIRIEQGQIFENDPNLGTDYHCYGQMGRNFQEAVRVELARIYPQALQSSEVLTKLATLPRV
jgi:hypothetical protein